MQSRQQLKQQAAVIGSGPNGLAAAIRLARAGLSPVVHELADRPGGGLASMEFTRPGFVHDRCAAVFPLAVASPFFRRVPLHDLGLRWIHPPVALAHPFDDGTAAVLVRSLTETASGFGRDGAAYERLMSPFLPRNEDLVAGLLSPGLPARAPGLFARFLAIGVLPFSLFARRRFQTPHARALLAGLAAHSFLRLEDPLSTAYGLVLALQAHAGGWPIVRGGSGELARALVRYLELSGGVVHLNSEVQDLDDLNPTVCTMLDVAPKHAASIAGDRLSSVRRHEMQNHRYGSSVFKIDYALDSPVPWTASACRRAGTIHLGGSLEEIEDAERAAVNGRTPERPFVLAAQPSLFDSSRAPAGKHTFWVYCHVPFRATEDMTTRIEDQIERFAPGFRERILDRSILPPSALEAINPNEVGGSISGGEGNLLAMARDRFPFRSPYTLAAPDLYLCSASTPPGPGVHGMSGLHAANRALSRLGLR